MAFGTQKKKIPITIDITFMFTLRMIVTSSGGEPRKLRKLS